MRQNKFRAWDGEKYWYDVIPFFESNEIILNNPMLGNKLHKVKVFEQFIGRKDKNKKEIYHRDILETNEKEMDGYILWLVVWYDEDMGFKFEGIGHTYSSCHNQVEKKGIIVGNSYENPELIN